MSIPIIYTADGSLDFQRTREEIAKKIGRKIDYDAQVAPIRLGTKQELGKGLAGFICNPGPTIILEPALANPDLGDEKAVDFLHENFSIFHSQQPNYSEAILAAAYPTMEKKWAHLTEDAILHEQGHGVFMGLVPKSAGFSGERYETWNEAFARWFNMVVVDHEHIGEMNGLHYLDGGYQNNRGIASRYTTLRNLTFDKSPREIIKELPDIVRT